MQGNFDLSPSVSPHALSNMLKIFLRDLTAAVLPTALYDDFVKLGRQVQSNNSSDGDNEADLKRLFKMVRCDATRHTLLN